MSKENAFKVLKEVQNAKDTLERNIFEVYRKHEQMDMFSYLDGRAKRGDEENDVYRIKRQVNDKIKLINDEIKDEVYNKKRSSEQENKTQAQERNRRYGRYSQFNKTYTQTSSNPAINNKSRITSTKPSKPKNKMSKGKPKESKKSEPPPTSSTAYDELILQHLYGRQPHQSHRHTLKNENPVYCAQHNLNTSQALQKTAPVVQSKNVTPNVVDIQPRNDYCLYLQPHQSSLFSISNSVPVARALSEPSRDPSERLPLSTVTKEAPNDETKITMTKPKNQLSKAAGPNVAVINIKADDSLEVENRKNRIRTKIRERYRRSKLNIQPLPNVDIDTTDPSSTISSDSTASVNGTVSKIDKSVDVSNANPYNFQDFISVQDISKKNVDITESDYDPEESFQQQHISLPGNAATQDQEYHGPIFPPQQSKTDENMIDTVSLKVTPTFEKNAQDWLEQELLARLISQIADQQNIIPSVDEHARNVDTISPEIDDSRSDNWIENVIGLQGIQFFVDAGIPVNEDLINMLLRSVILEYLETLFGHPEPKRNPLPPPTTVEVQGEMKVPTPVVTPLPSPRVSEKFQIQTTPDQTISDLSEQNVDDIIDKDQSLHEDNEEELHYKTVKTPDNSVIGNDDDYHPLNNIATPDVTVIDDVASTFNHNLATPLGSEKTLELTQIPITDFEDTEKNMSLTLSPVDKKLAATVTEFCITPVPVVLSVRSSPSTTSPSIPSTTVTMSSSATVGLSTFEEISSGEYLNADSVISEASEGELNLVGRFKSWNLGDESMNDSFISKSNTKRHLFPPLPPRTIERHSRSKGSSFLSEGEISQTFRPLKSIGEVSDFGIDRGEQTDVDTEDLEEDNDENDPMAKVLHKIKSPPSNKSYGELVDKSEGEITPHLMNIKQKQISDDDNDKVLFKEQSLLSDNISKTSLNNTDILNEVSDVVFSSKDNSYSYPEPAYSGSRIITVKPITDDENDLNIDKNFYLSEQKLKTDDKPNKDTSYVSKSEGELLQEVDMSSEVVSSEVVSSEEKEKVVMVLRLPEIEDEQNFTEDDVTTGDISSISEL